jgi:hypothetical protein
MLKRNALRTIYMNSTTTTIKKLVKLQRILRVCLAGRPT